MEKIYFIKEFKKYNLDNEQEILQLIKKYEDDFGVDSIIKNYKAYMLIIKDSLELANNILNSIMIEDDFNSDSYYLQALIKEKKGKFKQAYILYEEALYSSKKYNLKDILFSKEDINEKLEILRSFKVNKTSIVILTYNQLDYTKLCINSITKNVNPETYELVVVDNNSRDETRKWLLSQDNIKLILNESNMGFPKGCNQGIEISDEKNDILLLNNDTVVMRNTILNLRLALYCDENIGATGCVSNYVSNGQQINLHFNEFYQYINFANKNNIISDESYIKKLKLVGFAMLIKKSVLDEIGFLDERFTPGNFEDDDLSFRIVQNKKKLLLVNNSYIHHFGSVSFKEDLNAYNNLMSKNSKKFKEKWKISTGYSLNIRTDLIDLIKEDKLKEMNILEIGCACGATLLELENRYPNSRLYGIDMDKDAIKISESYYETKCMNIENEEFNYSNNHFDYILIGDVLEHLIEPEKVLNKIYKILNNKGRLITSIPNVMHYSNVINLLQGNWTYEDAGLLDRTHLRFYTKKEIIKMFSNQDYIVESMMAKIVYHENDREILDRILFASNGGVEEIEFKAYQYINVLIKDIYNSKEGKELKKLISKIESENFKNGKKIMEYIKALDLIDEDVINIINNDNGIKNKLEVLNYMAFLFYNYQYHDMTIPI